MLKYTETKIHEIDDPDFQSLVFELCHCVNLGKDQFTEQPLSYLFMAVVREKRAITKLHLPTNGILTMKVDRISTDSIVYKVCQELVRQKGTHIEFFDGKTILTLIKHCYKSFCPPLPKTLKQSQRKRSYNLMTKVIRQRRANGDL